MFKPEENVQKYIKSKKNVTSFLERTNMGGETPNYQKKKNMTVQAHMRDSLLHENKSVSQSRANSREKPK